MFSVTSAPNNHPYISRVEKEYIVEEIGPIVSDETTDLSVLSIELFFLKKNGARLPNLLL